MDKIGDGESVEQVAVFLRDKAVSLRSALQLTRAAGI